VHAAEKLKAAKKTEALKNKNRDAPNQELLMVLRQEYISDGGEEGFPWLH
jgi:hypothetical protein